MRRQSRSPARWAASSCGLPYSFTDPQDFTYTASAPTVASSGSSMMWTNSPPDRWAMRRIRAVSSGSSSNPGGRAITISMPRLAAASAALAGTAVGSALGCQAQVRTKRLPEGSPSFSRSVLA